MNDLFFIFVLASFGVASLGLLSLCGWLWRGGK